jgi:hypothetical protein
VLIFEDDVFLHPEFRHLVEVQPPPHDWGVILFGCTHIEAPQVAGPGWVRVKNFWSLYAYAVRHSCYDAVLKALREESVQAGREEEPDVLLSRLASKIPIYAVSTNLAWRENEYLHLLIRERQHFLKAAEKGQCRPGHQTTSVQAPETTNGRLEPAEFLSAEEVHERGGQKRTWCMETVFPSRRIINLEGRSDRQPEAERQFARMGLEVGRFPAVRDPARWPTGESGGDDDGGALAHCAVIEEAERSGDEAVLIFEDDVLLHARFREWSEATPLPADWGILYFGCQHTQDIDGVVEPGLVRATSAFTTHAYAVRRPFLLRAATAMRHGIRSGIPRDAALASLHREIPTYAFYPNLAWKAPLHADLKSATPHSFCPRGVQRSHRATLQKIDKEMRLWLRLQTDSELRGNRPGARGSMRFKCFWQKFDYSQAYGSLGPGMAMLFGKLQNSPFVVGSVFGHSPEPFDLLFSGECPPGFGHDGGFFVFREIHRGAWGKAHWFMGIPKIDHPRALHVPLFYLPWAERVATKVEPPKPAKGNRQFGISVVVGNLHHGSLAARRASLAHELSRFLPVHGTRALQSVAPRWSKVVYHDVPDKLKFIAGFTHHLCFENQAYPGYLTEKLFDSFFAGAVPLYHGDPLAHQWFDKNAIIDCNGLNAAEIAAAIMAKTELPRIVNAARHRLCRVSLAEMQNHIAAFQLRILQESAEPD